MYIDPRSLNLQHQERSLQTGSDSWLGHQVGAVDGHQGQHEYRVEHWVQLVAVANSGHQRSSSEMRNEMKALRSEVQRSHSPPFRHQPHTRQPEVLPVSAPLFAITVPTKEEGRQGGHRCCKGQHRVSEFFEVAKSRGGWCISRTSVTQSRVLANTLASAVPPREWRMTSELQAICRLIPTIGMLLVECHRSRLPRILPPWGTPLLRFSVSFWLWADFSSRGRVGECFARKNQMGLRRPFNPTKGREGGASQTTAPSPLPPFLKPPLKPPLLPPTLKPILVFQPIKAKNTRLVFLRSYKEKKGVKMREILGSHPSRAPTFPEFGAPPLGPPFNSPPFKPPRFRGLAPTLPSPPLHPALSVWSRLLFFVQNVFFFVLFPFFFLSRCLQTPRRPPRRPPGDPPMPTPVNPPSKGLGPHLVDTLALANGSTNTAAGLGMQTAQQSEVKALRHVLCLITSLCACVSVLGYTRRSRNAQCHIIAMC